MRSMRIGALVTGGLLLVGGQARGQMLTFEVEFDGEINGQTIDASGSGSLERQGMGSNFGTIGFEALPDNFSPLAVDALLTNVCPNGFRADGNADNLWDLGGGEYLIERTFQWVGFPGSTITSTAEVTFDADAQHLVSSMHFSGEYTGPTDLVAIESYSVLWLPSSTEGEVFEAGTALVRRATGDLLVVQFATRYFGLRDSLGQTQFGVGSFDTTFDGETLTIGWDGYFQVPAPGSLAIGGLAAAALARRRRRS